MRRVLLLVSLLLTLAAPAAADQCYLGRWVWNATGEQWEAPLAAQVTGSIDLRSLPQQGQAGGTADGYGLFCYDGPVVDANLEMPLGAGLDDAVGNPTRQLLAVKLGVPASIQSATLRDVIWELLTEHADPTGQGRWKPLMPGHDRTLKVRLGRQGVIKQAKLEPGVSPEWPMVLAALHDEYRRLKYQHPDPEKYRRTLSVWAEKFAQAPETFIPPDEVRVAALPHQTSITEDWDCTDADSPDCDLDWTEFTGDDFDIVSNTLETQTLNNGEAARAESSLSTDDHSAQVVVTQFCSVDCVGASTENDAAVLVRVEETGTSGLDYYMLRWIDAGSSSFWSCQIYKVVNDVFTQLATSNHSEVLTPFTLYGDVDGSDLELKRNTVSCQTVTDTAITGYTETGLRDFKGSAAGKVRFNNFEAADLGVAAARRVLVTQ